MLHLLAWQAHMSAARSPVGPRIRLRADENLRVANEIHRADDHH
jgi:hypothetical protein